MLQRLNLLKKIIICILLIGANLEYIGLTKLLSLLMEAMIMADDCGTVLRLKSNSKYKFCKTLLREHTRKKYFPNSIKCLITINT